LKSYQSLALQYLQVLKESVGVEEEGVAEGVENHHTLIYLVT